MAKRQSEPKWLTRLVVDAIHDDQIREHGGLAGLRDENVLESALARVRHKWSYADAASRVDLPALAAAYAFGLVRNHPYRDGNKRAGFLAMATFLGINGRELDATDADVIATILALADGTLSEPALAEWIRKHSRAEPV